ncbi:esterase family protein [Macrococcus sp. DPC7161]|uniref:alpha/beta hydrolase n=1 Tax=Macrococcus sp. DPC7161 TaxID=2507060 RepID=UPI00100BEDF5|nr:alpha/beta hydrolase-fold protein [Macrococcus sp. DPC7161]RXK18773.1 esterase family protein [Macrococcus sp. DPC7161]
MYKGKIINPEQVYSNYLNRDVKLGIYFQDNTVKSDVLICLDGQDFQQMGQIHRQFEALYQNEQIRHAIIVFVHYPNVDMRKREYHPESEFQSQMINFVIHELLPFIDENFNTIQSPNHRLVLGDSLAASIALDITLHHSNMINQACLFSPMIVAKYFTQFNQQDYYIIVGEDEFDFKLMSGESADFLTPIQDFHEHLNTLGVHHYYSEKTGSHTWKVWKPQIEHVLQYFLS